MTREEVMALPDRELDDLACSLQGIPTEFIVTEGKDAGRKCSLAHPCPSRDIGAAMALLGPETGPNPVNVLLEKDCGASGWTCGITYGLAEAPSRRVSGATAAQAITRAFILARTEGAK